MKTLKVISESPMVLKSGHTSQTKFYELNGVKYKIKYENSNGSSIGFNSKMCLMCFHDGKWNSLEDIKVLDIEPTPNYFSSIESKNHMIKFFKLMETHLVTVYS